MTEPRAYYNEHDKFAAAWLRNLIAAGHIAPGDVDERDIRDVRPDDVRGYTQCHWFAGIGGWPYALRLAGWPDRRPVWTGSCPCQPFSGAGKRKGVNDERHLWPDFFQLIKHARPAIVFGEQVASADGRIWLSRVRADLETLDHAVGAADLCAAGVSAPHIRQRIYWLGVANGDGSSTWNQTAPADRYWHPAHTASRVDNAGLADANGYHEHWWGGPVQVGWNGCEAQITRGGREHRAQWRLKPGLSIVAHGIPGRVGQLCGAGNAIVPQLAAEFIGAYLDAEHLRLSLTTGIFA